MSYVDHKGLQAAPSSRRETDEDYSGVLAVAADRRYRVINCKDSIQWIVQRRDKVGGRWRSQAYYRRKASLLRDLGNLPDRGFVGTLQRFPEIHMG